MRDDTRKRLERALIIRKLKWAGLAIAGLAAIGALFWVEGLDATTESHKVAGRVEAVGPVGGKSNAQMAVSTVAVDLKLDDGRVARVVAPKEQEPEVGKHIEIVEHVHGTGRHTFTWR